MFTFRFSGGDHVQHNFFSCFQEEKEYDIVVCATGRKVPLEGFERRSMEAQVGKMLERVARFCFSFWIVLGRIDIEG